MSIKSFFILGTDTGVGKTVVAVHFLRQLRKYRYSTIALKPLASGAQWISEAWKNADTLALQEAASLYLTYEQLNPFCFEQAIAPSIAARMKNCSLSVSTIIQSCQDALNCPVDFCVIEGLGGVYVPLNERETLLDLVKTIDFPVILVVGLRLGCLNHALLTYEVLKARNIPVVGWVANQIDPMMQYPWENVEVLKGYIQSTFLGYVPYTKDKKALEVSININWQDLILNS